MKTIVLALCIMLPAVLLAQGKYFTKTGTISFDATNNRSLEDVTAQNRTVSAVLDTKTGSLLFVVLLKGFEFKKALMQEHFNENYVESDKFPKAEFKGQVVDISRVDLNKEGNYPVTVKGTLTLHGKSNSVETTGTIHVRGGSLQSNAVFLVNLKEYNISVPTLVEDKVSKTARITVDCLLEPFKG